MKEEYEKLVEAVADCYCEFKDNIYPVISGPKLDKSKERLYRKFKAIEYAVNKVGAFIPQIDPITLQNEWGGEKFAVEWAFYKDYLKEQHGFIMTSRMELKRLKYIRNACSDNVDIAIKYLDTLESIGTKSVIAIDDIKLDSQIQISKENGKSTSSYKLQTTFN